MESSVHHAPPRARRSGTSHRWLIGPMAAMLLAIAVLLGVMVGPRACGLVYPASASCFAGQFDAALTLWILSIAVVGVTVVAIGAFVPLARRAISIAGATLIAGSTLTLIVVRVALFGPVGG